MSISRRKWITGGLATTAGAASLAATAGVAKHYGLVAPDSGGIFGLGEALTYASHRVLAGQSPAREFSRDQISAKPFANGDIPKDDAFKQHQATGFADWKLTIDGMVARPGAFTMAQLKSYPSRSQITHIACEEGWSYIAEWTGVPLSHILEVAGAHPQSKYVVYFSHDKGWWDSLDMAEAMHPQTVIAHGMNGADMPVEFGGPLRMRVPRQLGYKSVKYITRLTVTDDIKKFGKGLGSAAPEGGYAWYAGI